MRTFETLPRWNNDWDPPDPLRGKQGWALRHYVRIGVGIVVLAVVLPVVLLATNKPRKKAEEMNNTYREVQEAIERASVHGHS